MSPVADAITILGGLVILLGLFWAAQRLRAIPMAAQVEAKDAVISTWEQNAEADKSRIAALSDEVKGLRDELAQALRTIARLQGQVEQLEKFSAPEAVERFERQQGVMIGILRSLAEHNGVETDPIRGRGL